MTSLIWHSKTISKKELVESLQSHCIHTQFHWSSGPPVCFPSWGTRVQSPGEVLMVNRDSPVSVVSLHWCPWRDLWSLWPRLRLALSQTVTRLTCWQCDNTTWSHTALLSRFHARCRSSFQLHNQHSRLLGGSPVESLQSHCIHTKFHWSSGPPVCFPSWGTRVQSQGGVLLWNRDFPVSVVCYKLFFVLSSFFLSWGFVSKNSKNGPSKRWKFFPWK